MSEFKNIINDYIIKNNLNVKPPKLKKEYDSGINLFLNLEEYLTEVSKLDLDMENKKNLFLIGEKETIENYREIKGKLNKTQKIDAFLCFLNNSSYYDLEFQKQEDRLKNIISFLITEFSELKDKRDVILWVDESESEEDDEKAEIEYTREAIISTIAYHLTGRKRNENQVNKEEQESLNRILKHYTDEVDKLLINKDDIKEKDWLIIMLEKTIKERVYFSKSLSINNFKELNNLKSSQNKLDLNNFSNVYVYKEEKDEDKITISINQEILLAHLNKDYSNNLQNAMRIMIETVKDIKPNWKWGVPSSYGYISDFLTNKEDLNDKKIVLEELVSILIEEYENKIIKIDSLRKNIKTKIPAIIHEIDLIKKMESIDKDVKTRKNKI